MIPLPPACTNCPARSDAQGFVPASGPPGAKALIIGQGPGQQEVLGGAPFIGPSGQRLTKWCIRAGFPKREARVWNIVQCGLPKDRPPKPAEVAYCREHHWGRELEGKRLIVAVGVPAMKALVDPAATIADAGRFTELQPDQFAVGIAHPAAILRGGWGLDPAQPNYLKLAKRVLEGERPYIPDWSQPSPLTNMWPTLSDLTEWEARLGPRGISVDVEAAGNILRLIGLRSLDTLEGVEVGLRQQGGEPWIWCPKCAGRDPSCDHPEDQFDEMVWWLARLLADASIPKTLQNGQAYDVPEQLMNVGFVVRGFEWDTLLMAHIRQPEMPKGLESLGGAFLGLCGWKRSAKIEAEGDLK